MPEVIRARTIETLRQMLLAASRRRPLLVVLEDLHWIDPASEDYLTTLVDSARRHADSPGGDAPARLAAALGRPTKCTAEIVLPPLGEVESRALIEDVADRTRLPDVARPRTSSRRPRATRSSWAKLARAVVEQGDHAHSGDRARQPAGRAERAHRPAGRRAQAAACRPPPSSGASSRSGCWRRCGTGPARWPRSWPSWRGSTSCTSGPPAAIRSSRSTTRSRRRSPTSSLLTGTAGGACTRRPPTASRRRTASTAWSAPVERIAYHWTRTPRADKAVESLRRVATRAMGDYANAEALAALREAETHAERLDSDRERVLVQLLLERSQTRSCSGRSRRAWRSCGRTPTSWSASAIPRSPRSITSAWRPPSACSARVAAAIEHAERALVARRGRRRRRHRGPGPLHPRARVILVAATCAAASITVARPSCCWIAPASAGGSRWPTGRARSTTRCSGSSTTRSTRSPGRRRSRTSSAIAGWPARPRGPEGGST